MLSRQIQRMHVCVCVPVCFSSFENSLFKFYKCRGEMRVELGKMD